MPQTRMTSGSRHTPKTETAAKQKYDNSRLIDFLDREAMRRGIHLSQVASLIGISKSYFDQLRYGQRSAQGLTQAIVDKIARFTNAPAISVLMLIGVVKPSDFFHGTRAEVEQAIYRAYDAVKADREFGEFMPAPKKLSVEMMLGLVLAYEAATNKVLIGCKVNTRDVMRKLLSDGSMSG